VPKKMEGNYFEKERNRLFYDESQTEYRDS
jgi:hypothetical protein